MNLKVHWNYHKKKLSVVFQGKVIDHVDHISLRGARFVVQPGGRARAVREKRRNVHAYIVGQLITSAYLEKLIAGMKEVPVTYNPFKYKNFVRVSSKRAVKEAPFVQLAGKNITAYLPQD